MDKIIGDAEYAAEWLVFAERDLSSARHLLTHHPVPLEIICFLCQQAAEKCLKGFLVIRNVQPPKIHDLIDLLTLCGNYLIDAGSIAESCNRLNRYSVMPRSPRELAIVDADIAIALQAAQTVMDFFQPYLLPFTKSE